jgi:hypothetical protein
MTVLCRLHQTPLTLRFRSLRELQIHAGCRTRIVGVCDDASPEPLVQYGVLAGIRHRTACVAR